MRVTDPILTVIIPMFNEAKTIARLLDAVEAAAYSKQVIVVDDGSRDGSLDEVFRWREQSAGGLDFEILCHPENNGKGSAIRTALPRARGKIVLIQDADLECDPADYPTLVEPILQGVSRVVFGSRYLGRGSRYLGLERQMAWTPSRTFVLLANSLVWILFGRRITDEAGCYKVMATDLLRSLNLRCRRFEFCPEVTAKLCRLGIAIHEVPVRYTPRDIKSGKKIGWRDAFEAIGTLIWWRLASIRGRELPGESKVIPLDQDRIELATPVD
jgi:dolichol-phosphate mannosyltransferase